MVSHFTAWVQLDSALVTTSLSFLHRRTTITTHHKRSRAPRVISAVSQVWTCAVGRRGAKRMQLVCSSVQGAVRALHSCGVRRDCGDDPECYRGSALAGTTVVWNTRAAYIKRRALRPFVQCV
jgi:hypothetical protein